MNWRERAYQAYFEHYLKIERGDLSKENIKKQFPVWNSYYSRFLPIDKNASILDLGCGNGELLFWLKLIGFYNARGIDQDLRLIEEAKKLDVKVCKDDIKSFLSDKSQKFDCIIARDVIEHFTKDEIFEVLDLIYGALRQGGVLIIQTPNAESPFGARYRYYDFTHCIGFTSSSLRHVLGATGFKNITFKEAGPVPHGIISLCRFILWRAVVLCINLYLFIETGSRKGLFTQNIIVRSQKL
ncbi:MAG: class I SAM-dependent methyltransferase [Candidatus Liptonbacteria bacterium]|nr:class I SAM-dependent methyltransferase [Candidatus Liptonbacteria bacterium]